MALFSRLSALAKRAPIVASAFTVCGQFTCGDIIAQAMGGTPLGELDRRRTAAFASFGLFCGLGPYHLFYNVLYSTAPFVRAGALATAAFDAGVALPTWYFSSFYTFKEVMASGWSPLAGPGGGSGGGGGGDVAVGQPSPSLLDDVIPRALGKWRADFWENLQACFTVPFLQVVLMAKYVPNHLKSPFIASTGLVWVVLLSTFRGAASPTETEEEEAGAEQQ